MALPGGGRSTGQVRSAVNPVDAVGPPTPLEPVVISVPSQLALPPEPAQLCKSELHVSSPPAEPILATLRHHQGPAPKVQACSHTGNSLKHPGSKESLNCSTSNGTSDADHVDAHDMTDDEAEAGSMDEHERLSHISYHRLGLEWILLRRIPGTKWFRWSNGSSQTFTQEAKDQLPKSHTTAFWVRPCSLMRHYQMTQKRTES
eukprot:bmy_13581T0